jgi:hypothetical protein
MEMVSALSASKRGVEMVSGIISTVGGWRGELFLRSGGYLASSSWKLAYPIYLLYKTCV